MTRPEDDWKPGPELLSAYFDGELSVRPDLDALRQRIEDWLSFHPEASADLDEYRLLGRLWKQTTPRDPGPRAWEELEARLRQPSPPESARPRRSALGRRLIALSAAAASIGLVLWLGFGRQILPEPPASNRIVRPAPSAAREFEVFPVATASEVTILSVEGADTHTVVVGELPLRGPMELAGPGEVAFTDFDVDGRDYMLPHLRAAAPHRPMIWAPMSAEDR